jgi:hypothetical protein
MLAPSFSVESPDVAVSDGALYSAYRYHTSAVRTSPGGHVALGPTTRTFHFKTELRVPRCGALIVGLGGNNGTTR